MGGSSSHRWILFVSALYRKKAVTVGRTPSPTTSHFGQSTQSSPFNGSHAMGAGAGVNIFGQPVAGGAAAQTAAFTGGETLPDGTTKAAFLRQCRATFLQ
ncbi:MAG: Tim44 domain-containing protein, partial [Pseudomonadota bacterium]|nr:Tim44 domain-containing protein [Pseudomonadota bacterium]